MVSPCSSEWHRDCQSRADQSLGVAERCWETGVFLRSVGVVARRDRAERKNSAQSRVGAGRLCGFGSDEEDNFRARHAPPRRLRPSKPSCSSPPPRSLQGRSAPASFAPRSPPRPLRPRLDSAPPPRLRPQAPPRGLRSRQTRLQLGCSGLSFRSAEAQGPHWVAPGFRAPCAQPSAGQPWRRRRRGTYRCPQDWWSCARYWAPLGTAVAVLSR